MYCVTSVTNNISKKYFKREMGIAYATVKHGANLVDPGETVDWDSNKGRWFIGLFTNDSDEIESRQTSTSYE